MPKITEELVRKRSEHNNCEIATLQELSLHQQEIEKIEHLDRWCRDLRILYLQNNLIPRIENVGRLKQLQYLNLALNNIERIENLEGCEFLEKLDLTINFVGDLLSVESLCANHHLHELYLTGNPCTDYEHYRDFVVATLPQLKTLDGKEISKSERILATQKLEEIRAKISQQQKEHALKREREKEEHSKRKKKRTTEKAPGFDGRWYTDPNAHLANEEGHPPIRAEDAEDCESDDEEFWNEPTAYTPESRIEVHEHMAEKRKEKGKKCDGPDIPKRTRRLERDGRMLNVNEGRYDFSLVEDEAMNQYVLEVECPRFMDTSLMECDVQPTYVRVTIKGKVLQLVFQEDVSPDKSSSKRSQTTGKLVLTMPKAREVVKPTAPQKTKLAPFLEVDPTVSKVVDITNIIPRDQQAKQHSNSSSSSSSKKGSDRGTALVNELGGSEVFIDDADVPPLI